VTRWQPPARAPVLHITSEENLPKILADGGLRCCADLNARNVKYTNIAHSTIQAVRAATTVPIAPGGTLHDYVPFYFCARSPMLYTISRGNVSGYTQGQHAIVYLVSTAEAISAARLPYVITDGHATKAYTSFFGSLSDLDRVDWPLMHEQFWNDTPEDPNRKWRRQAEFLVHRFVPWNLILGIAVSRTAWEHRVRTMLRGASHVPDLAVRRGWYY